MEVHGSPPGARAVRAVARSLLRHTLGGAKTGGTHALARLLRPLRSNPRTALSATAAVLAVLGTIAGLGVSGALTPAASISRTASAAPKPKLPARPGGGVTLTTADAAIPSGTVTVTSSQPVANGDLVSVSYTASTANSENWIGLYPQSTTTPDGSYVTWEWAPDASGTVELSTEGLAAGTYNVYLLYDDGYGVMAGPAPVTVAAPPVPTAAFGTPAMDATDDPIWNTTPAINISASDSPVSAVTRFMWDAKYLYVLVTVNDSTPVYNQSSPPGLWPGYQQGLYNDSVDFWINWTDSTSATYDNNTATAIDITRGGVVAENSPSASPGSDPSVVLSDVVSTSTQYTVEAAFPWPDTTRPGSPVGINTSINDITTDGGYRASYITWDTVDQYWETPAGMPTVTPTGGDNNGQIFSNDNPLNVQLKQTADVPTWPQLVSGGGVTYSSADPAVASVSSDGVVTGLLPGTTIITASASGFPSEQITVNVTLPPGPYGFAERAFTGPGSGLVHPSGVAVDASGDVWVSDEGRDDVAEFSPQGRVLQVFGSSGSGNGQLSEPEAIAVSGSDVYVADTGNNRVEEFTTKGAFVRTIGSLGTGNGQFTSPEGVAVDGSGDLWVSDTTDNRLEEFSPAGSYVKSITGLSGPQGLTFGAGGDLWVADNGTYDFGGDSIVEFDPSSGVQIGQVDNNYGSAGATGLSNPSDVAVDAGGNLYVPEPDYDIVTVLAPTGAVNDELGAPAGNNNGKLNPAGLADTLGMPQSVALDSAGDLFVADKENHRIVEFIPLHPAAVTTEPADTTVGQGGTATFRAAASGTPEPTVQWEAEAPGATSFTPIPGATHDTLVIPDVTLAQSGTQYKAVFTNTIDIDMSPQAIPVSSASATLTVVK